MQTGTLRVLNNKDGAERDQGGNFFVIFVYSWLYFSQCGFQTRLCDTVK